MEGRKNFLLKQAINSAQEVRWNQIDINVIEEFKPRSQSIVKVIFGRGAAFPTNQILLEFMVLEKEKKDNSPEYSYSYLYVIYVQKNMDGKYQKIGTFRKFVP